MGGWLLITIIGGKLVPRSLKITYPQFIQNTCKFKYGKIIWCDYHRLPHLVGTFIVAV